ncbi:hypothetical protein [Paenibacillus sp. Root444D2]|uniref:hypothetical protein n=1 Tax=Paenibacillus sp. Root444D2 TaxID=1736538 RepID=UPI00070D5A0B|nr:hypothetical protein [Paenibacillus sp. Root444D2]KQX48639.1 hypothetical protein ASD40_10685 [Paenibacillus sp. Root444D2]
MKIVPDKFEFGIEKEYAIVYKERDFVSYLLASQQIINKIKSMSDIHENLVKKVGYLFSKGWEIHPEYSNALIEVVSPPYTLDSFDEIIDGFQVFEEVVSHLLIDFKEKNTNLKGEILLTDKFSSSTDTFINFKKEKITDIKQIILTDEAVTFVGSENLIPSSFKKINDLNLLYAGFISTHVTLHPKYSSRWDIKQEAEYFWSLLDLLFSSEYDINDNTFYYKGKEEIRCSTTPRSELISWADTTSIFYEKSIKQIMEGDAQEKIDAYNLFLNEQHKGNRTYLAKIKHIEEWTLFEIRRFHSGISINYMKEFLLKASKIIINP